ncbi:unnamed protein product [Phaeothamnion confervicola]
MGTSLVDTRVVSSFAERRAGATCLAAITAAAVSIVALGGGSYRRAFCPDAREQPFVPKAVSRRQQPDATQLAHGRDDSRGGGGGGGSGDGGGGSRRAGAGAQRR